MCYDPDWTTCLGCGSGLYEYELCPECGYCDRCCECDLVLTRLLRDLEALAQTLRQDVEAAGLYEAACQIEEIIRKYKRS